MSDFFKFALSASFVVALFVSAVMYYISLARFLIHFRTARPLNWDSERGSAAPRIRDIGVAYKILTKISKGSYRGEKLDLASTNLAKSATIKLYITMSMFMFLLLVFIYVSVNK